MNKNYLLALSKHKYMTIKNQNGHSRVMCFEKETDAKRCKHYIMHHRHTYGTWPLLDLSKPETKVKFQSQYTKDDMMQIEIKEIDDNKLDFYCTNKKMNFLMCKSFNTYYEANKHILDFTGEELLCSTTDIYSNVNNLNTIYRKIT